MWGIIKFFTELKKTLNTLNSKETRKNLEVSKKKSGKIKRTKSFGMREARKNNKKICVYYY